MMFSSKEKFNCAVRELRYRQHVYKRRVEAKQMTEKLAKHEIALMEDIVADYRTLVAAEQLPFEEEGDAA